uniref:Uncharacterized protein n=1 Tax=Glossina brevipalpis TaxID=37001 RepID=A0A1A9VZV9_9MUSC
MIDEQENGHDYIKTKFSIDQGLKSILLKFIIPMKGQIYYTTQLRNAVPFNIQTAASAYQIATLICLLGFSHDDRYPHRHDDDYVTGFNLYCENLRKLTDLQQKVEAVIGFLLFILLTVSSSIRNLLQSNISIA